MMGMTSSRLLSSIAASGAVCQAEREALRDGVTPFGANSNRG
jgi:hypothetical protein